MRVCKWVKEFRYLTQSQKEYVSGNGIKEGKFRNGISKLSRPGPWLDNMPILGQQLHSHPCMEYGN